MVLTREVCEEIKNNINNALGKCMSDQAFIKTLADNVSEAVTKTVNKKLQILEQKINDLKTNLQEMKADTDAKIDILDVQLKKMNGENESLVRNYDYMEQNMKRNNLRIFNFQEKSNENTRQEIMTLLNSKLNCNIKDQDIELCYRIGKTDNSTNTKKARGILLKLKDYEIRQTIYHAKKMLKGTGVIIREDLTKIRMELMTMAIERTSVKNVWTEAGKIFVNVNGKIHIVTAMRDFKQVFNM
ncbi:unnamed protein product [Phaedon cochleariae]|uniref:Uncharacterized protein n=1 Tax=Phaedon cochleariae TaxID=80249 RepID=A0A9P0DRM3_PHACE|nr:unnamed protein product [Phaedon cochleariae]